MRVSEIGTHWFDIAEYLSGQEIEQVSAMFANYTPNRIVKDGIMYPDTEGKEATVQKITVESEDAAVIQMKFKNQAIGSVILSEVSPGRGNHLSLEITGTDGNLWWNEEENNQLFVAKHGESVRKEVFAFWKRFSETFTTMFESFYQAVESEKTSDGYPDFERGARIAQICQSVWKSAKQTEPGRISD